MVKNVDAGSFHSAGIQLLFIGLTHPTQAPVAALSAFTHFIKQLLLQFWLLLPC